VGRLDPLLTLTPKGDAATTVSVAMSPTGEALAVWVGKFAAIWQQSSLPWPIRARFGP
jgi:hypothetical protein